MTHIILNDQLLTREEATISCADRGFRFGDGVFDTIALYDGILYQFALHMARLTDGLDALKIDLKDYDFYKHIKILINKLHVTDGFIRIQVSRGVGSAGYRPLPNTQPTIVIEFLPRHPAPRPPANLWLSSYCKPPASSYPVSIKTAQGLNSILALLEADGNGCDEALMLNASHQLCEAASGNLFWVKDKMLYTPALSTGCLAGTTREAVIRLSIYPVRECTATLDALQKADCVFLTNCNWLILPVATLKPQGWSWPTDHIALTQFTALLRADIKLYCEQHHGR